LSRIINSLIRIKSQNILEKLKKHFGIVLLMFLNINVTCLVVEASHQFHPLMFPISGDNPLLSNRKPCFHDSLVIPNHRLVFIQNDINIVI